MGKNVILMKSSSSMCFSGSVEASAVRLKANTGVVLLSDDIPVDSGCGNVFFKVSLALLMSTLLSALVRV